MNAVDVSIVVPVFNNAATLPELTDRLVAVLERLGLSFEIIFIDDGSTDGSRRLLDERAARDARLRVYSLSRNFGGQAARCAGFELVHGRRTVCIDADLENHPEDIPALLAALDQGHDLACAVREKRGDRWASRRLPSAILNSYARRRLRTPVRDLWCGMRAMDSRIVRDLAVEGDRRRLLTPLFIDRARSVIEVAVRHDAAQHGSHYSPVTLAAVAADFCMGTANQPFLVAALVACLTCAGSVLVLAIALAARNTGLAVAALVVAVGGAVGALIAAVGMYVQRTYELVQGRPLFRLRLEEGNARPLEGPPAQDGA